MRLKRMRKFSLLFVFIAFTVTSFQSVVYLPTYASVESSFRRTKEISVASEILDLVTQLNEAGVEVPGLYVQGVEDGKTVGEWKSFPSYGVLELIENIKSYSVVKDVDQIIALLEDRLALANGEGTSGRFDGNVEQLYELLFTENVGSEGTDIVAFRGGRGAKPFSEIMRDRGSNITLTPGAVDDGRSWLIFSQLFQRPGIPDKGKCILELATIDGISDFFNKRVGSLAELEALANDPRSLDVVKANISSVDPKQKEGILASLQAYAGAYLEWLNKVVGDMSNSAAASLSMDSLRKLKWDLLPPHPKSYNWSGGGPNNELGLLNRLRGNLEAKLRGNLEAKLGNAGIAKAREIATAIYSKIDEADATQSWDGIQSDIEDLIGSDNWKVFLEATIDAVMQVTEFHLPLRSIALIGADRIAQAGKNDSVSAAIAGISNLVGVDPRHQVAVPNLGQGFITAVYKRADGGAEVFNAEDFLNERPKPGELYAIMFTSHPVSMEHVDQWNGKDPDIVVRNIEENYHIDIESNPVAEDALREADLIFYFPTTVESNRMPSTLISEIARAIYVSDAIKILIPNGRIESEASGTQLSDKIEDEFRVMSGQQRYVGGSMTTVAMSNYIDYVIVRSQDNGQTEYLPVDEAAIISLGLTPIRLNIDDPLAPGNCICSLAMRAAYVLRGLDNLELRVDAAGSLVGADGIDLSGFLGLPISMDPDSYALSVTDPDQRADIIIPQNKTEKFSTRNLKDFQKPGGILLQDASVLNPETADNILYYMYNHVYASSADREAIADRNLQFNVTIMPPQNLGDELIKTSGHFHGEIQSPGPDGKKFTYVDVYEVIQGEALVLLQHHEGGGTDGPVDDVVAVYAHPGDKVIIPPNYAHVLINVGETDLITADWASADNSSIYDAIEKNNGASYYVVTDGNGGHQFIANEDYQDLPSVRICEASQLAQRFRLNVNGPSYNAVIADLSILDFINAPWELFTFNEKVEIVR